MVDLPAGWSVKECVDDGTPFYVSSDGCFSFLWPTEPAQGATVGRTLEGLEAEEGPPVGLTTMVSFKQSLEEAIVKHRGPRQATFFNGPLAEDLRAALMSEGDEAVSVPVLFEAVSSTHFVFEGWPAGDILQAVASHDLAMLTDDEDRIDLHHAVAACEEVVDFGGIPGQVRIVKVALAVTWRSPLQASVLALTSRRELRCKREGRTEVDEIEWHNFVSVLQEEVECRRKEIGLLTKWSAQLGQGLEWAAHFESKSSAKPRPRLSNGPPKCGLLPDCNQSHTQVLEFVHSIAPEALVECLQTPLFALREEGTRKNIHFAAIHFTRMGHAVEDEAQPFESTTVHVVHLCVQWHDPAFEARKPADTMRRERELGFVVPPVLPDRGGAIRPRATNPQSTLWDTRPTATAEELERRRGALRAELGVLAAAVRKATGCDGEAGGDQLPLEFVLDLRKRLQSINYRNHELKLEINHIYYQRTSRGSPTAFDIVAETARLPERFVSDAMPAYGRMLAHLRASPKLIVMLGLLLPPQAQEDFVGFVTHALFDWYSTDERGLLGTIAFAIQEHFRVAQYDPSNPLGKPSLVSSLLSAYVTRKPCSEYVHEALGGTLPAALRHLDVNVSSVHLEGSDSTADTSYGRQALPDLGCLERDAEALGDVVADVLNAFIGEQSLGFLPPGLVFLCQHLYSAAEGAHPTAGVRAVNSFFFSLLVIPTLAQPENYGLGSEREHERVQRNLALVVAALHRIVLPTPADLAYEGAAPRGLLAMMRPFVSMARAAVDGLPRALSVLPLDGAAHSIEFKSPTVGGGTGYAWADTVRAAKFIEPRPPSLCSYIGATLSELSSVHDYCLKHASVLCSGSEDALHSALSDLPDFTPISVSEQDQDALLLIRLPAPSKEASSAILEDAQGALARPMPLTEESVCEIIAVRETLQRYRPVLARALIDEVGNLERGLTRAQSFQDELVLLKSSLLKSDIASSMGHVEHHSPLR